jgi:hypothetical protein
VLPALSGGPGEAGLRVELGPLSGVLPPQPGSTIRIWTGHQAEFWHPGIMAKYLAAAAIADRVRAAGGRASVTWLVVDQDANEPWKVAYPAEVEGKLVKWVWNLPFAGGVTASAATFSSDTPACALPALTPGVPPKAALQSAAEGLEAIRAALTRHQREPNAAREVTKALCDLLEPWCRPDDIVFASDLSRSREFGTIVNGMRADPVGCVQAYNAAVVQLPSAHVRPMQVQGDRVELPLWRIPTEPGRPRRAVWSGELADLKNQELAPRALTMTAIVRLSLCDLFIHGTGGGIYDQITERWLSSWGKCGRLAPTAVVTATRHLPFSQKVRTPEEIARAQWRAHAARHSPGVLGDAKGEARRRELVGAVKSARARGVPPRREFEALHQFLAGERNQHAAKLQQLEHAAAVALEDSDIARVVYERAWPFPLYPRAVLDDLAREVNAAVGGAVQTKA